MKEKWILNLLNRGEQQVQQKSRKEVQDVAKRVTISCFFCRRFLPNRTKQVDYWQYQMEGILKTILEWLCKEESFLHQEDPQQGKRIELLKMTTNKQVRKNYSFSFHH